MGSDIQRNKHENLLTGQMSAFKNTPELRERVDYQIIANGWFQLYSGPGGIDADKLWLENEGYEIAEFDCHGMSNLLNQLKEHFDFPPYFHHSFYSLDDCLENIEISGIGLVVIFKHIDSLAKHEIKCLLEIFVEKARRNFIIGKRLLILALAGDNSFQAAYVGKIEIR